MHNSAYSVWRVRLLTFVTAAVAAAGASYWVLKLQQAPSGLGVPVALSAPAGIDAAKLARLLGASNTSTSAAPAALPANTLGRYKLQGVIAQGTQGSALITTDGAPPKVYRVGQNLADDLVLQSVARRSAVLGSSLQSPPTLTLELPSPGAPTATPPSTP